MVGEIVLFGLWCVLVWDLVRRAKGTKVEIAKLKRENYNLAAAVVKQGKRIDLTEDHEVRITFMEKGLTSKTATAKIVPKAHKATFRQFAQAASQASESQETE
jgi:hypothetical protein